MLPQIECALQILVISRNELVFFCIHMKCQDETTKRGSPLEVLAQLMPITLISLPFAIGNFFLAKRLSKNQVLWVVLSLIPLCNIFFFWYVVYKSLFAILDRLDRNNANVS